MLHADAYFAIGHRHLVCQDYARAGTIPREPLGSPVHFAIVADGCSSSADTDIGARLLVRSLSRALPQTDLRVALGRAAAHAQSLALDTSALDCTLLYVVADDDSFEVCVTGDGVVAAVRSDGLVDLWEIDCDNRPSYLSYFLDRDRLAAYVQSAPLRQVRSRTLIPQAGVTTPDVTAQLAISGAHIEEMAWRLSLPTSTYRQVAVFSDGVASMRAESADDEAPSTTAVIAELLQFKTTTGAFVTRRCRRFLGKTCAKRGWTWHDDIAVAVVSREEPA